LPTSASTPAASTAPVTGADARQQLRAQRKADILAVANDTSLTLEQQKAKIAVIRADYNERLGKLGATAPDSEAAAPSLAPQAAATASQAPSPAPIRPAGRAKRHALDDQLLP
jgi:hypothetical protein